MAASVYDETFFSHHEQGSRDSARQTIPIVFEFARPASLVDVGCGIGTWLAEFQAAGVSDVVGIDGDYVERDKLLIAPERFLARNLEQPLDLGRQFDVAMSLEVAEHLSEQSADTFVASLVHLAPLVLFSAAIPHQGGTHHVNEQWPGYWHAKFSAHDYVVVDCLRERLWRNANIMPWYAQNMLFFVRRNRLADYPAMAERFARDGNAPPLWLVHPGHYLGLYRHQKQEIDKLYQELRTAHRTMLRDGLKLREINLVVLPDWNLPAKSVLDQLRELCIAMFAHPAAARMTLVTHLANQDALDLLRRATDEARALAGSSLVGEPMFGAVDDSFSPYQWELLRDLVQTRAVLANNNDELIAKTAAGALPTATLAALKAKQLFTTQ